jgi:hypothetical protein
MPLDIKLTPDSTGLKDFLSALVSPLQTATESLNIFSALYEKRVRFNGRKMVLQAALNDIFGITVEPYILIETYLDFAENVYLYEPSESTPLSIFEEAEDTEFFFFESAEIPTEVFDFIVKIPAGIYTLALDRRIKAETTLLKLAGKTFITQTY